MSARVDDFFAFPCTVKNKRNLAESLKSSIQSEILDGDNKYQCDDCKTKVTAIKRTCIQTLPETLILHLKRIDFDFEICERAKINDRFEFPDELDMFDYTLEAQEPVKQPDEPSAPPSALDRDHYKYRLSGILVHRFVFLCIWMHV